MSLLRLSLIVRACALLLPLTLSTAPPLAASARGELKVVDNAWDMRAFGLKGLDGLSHELSDWKGKVILLNFWATWCPPCQAEIPDLIEY